MLDKEPYNAWRRRLPTKEGVEPKNMGQFACWRIAIWQPVGRTLGRIHRGIATTDGIPFAALFAPGIRSKTEPAFMGYDPE